MIMKPLSAWHLVVTAYSTATGSAGSMSWSTTVAIFREGCAANAARSAFLGSPSRRFFICMTAASQLLPPSVRCTDWVVGTTFLIWSYILASKHYLGVAWHIKLRIAADF